MAADMLYYVHIVFEFYAHFGSPGALWPEGAGPDPGPGTAPSGPRALGGPKCATYILN